MIVQVYGLTTPDDAVMVATLGADHIGLVAGVRGRTPDEVDFATARAILAAVPPGVKTVALTIADDLDEIEAMARAVQPDILHLAAPLAQFSADGAYRVKRRLPGLPLMQSVAVTGPLAYYVAVNFAGVVDYLLLDSRDPDSGQIGVTGLTHDWSISRRIVQSVLTPVILAGGLHADNVAAAIQAVGPAGVDSQSGTSRADNPLRKDTERVRRFIEAARAG
ncbi:MAG: phosphoribosylanthranilate isomerase [Anaerolineae bacterium]|nr:phosphoribosylanthranilate isomerase [Anaerolineae bacterium]